MYASLFLTLGCNLRCTYCFAGTKVNMSMTPEIALKAVDYLYNASDDHLNITFFGGEPMLRYNLIKRIVSYCDQFKDIKKINFGMTTNGTLFNDESIDFLRKHDVTYTLSFDGNRKTQDLGRPTVTGGSSFDLVMRNIPKMLNANPWLKVNVVVTTETAPYLAENVKFLRSIGLRYLNLILDHGAEWGLKELNVLKKEYKKLAEYYIDCHRNGTKIWINFFDDKIAGNARLQRCESGSPCESAKNSVAIAPSGRIYPCVQFVQDDEPQDYKWVIGDISSGIDPMKQAQYLSCSAKPASQECKDCVFLKRCNSMCSCDNYQATGNPATPSAFMCEHERMLIPLADKVASQLWRERNDLFINKHYNNAYPLMSYMEDTLVNLTK